MAGSIYTTRIWATNAAQNQAVNSAPVPGGYVWVMRDVVINVGNPGGRVTLWVISGIDAFVVFNQVLETNSSFHFDMRQVLVETENLRGHSAETAWSVLVTAYQLTAIGDARS